MYKKWQICQTDREKVEQIKSNYQINELLATILVNRNIVQKEDIRHIFKPNKTRFLWSIFNNRYGNSNTKNNKSNKQ